PDLHLLLVVTPPTCCQLHPWKGSSAPVHSQGWWLSLALPALSADSLHPLFHGFGALFLLPSPSPVVASLMLTRFCFPESLSLEQRQAQKWWVMASLVFHLLASGMSRLSMICIPVNFPSGL